MNAVQRSRRLEMNFVNFPSSAKASPRLIGHEIYRNSSYGRWHPLRIPRVSTVLDLSNALGYLPEGYIRAPRAKAKALQVWHEPEYLTALQEAEQAQEVSSEDSRRFNIGTATNPIFPEIWRRPATSAGGSLLAGELLRDGGIIYHPAGGTHHAMPGAAGGFCYLNDPVLSILSLKRNDARRVAYVDIDAHHPDGVEYGFTGDPDTLMISIHEDGLWPRTGSLTEEAGGSAFNLPVPRKLNDDEMAFAREELILPKVAAFKPDAIVLQCGADAVEEDPLSHLSLSNNAHWDIVQALMPLAPRLLVLGGGGYNPWSVGRLWTGVWATLKGFEIPDRLPSAAETVLRRLEFRNNRRGKIPPDDWFTTLRDPPRNGEIRPEIRDRVKILLRR